jgi:hypothetical protein
VSFCWASVAALRLGRWLGVLPAAAEVGSAEVLPLGWLQLKGVEARGDALANAWDSAACKSKGMGQKRTCDVNTVV